MRMGEKDWRGEGSRRGGGDSSQFTTLDTKLETSCLWALPPLDTNPFFITKFGLYLQIFTVLVKKR